MDGPTEFGLDPELGFASVELVSIEGDTVEFVLVSTSSEVAIACEEGSSPDCTASLTGYSDGPLIETISRSGDRVTVNDLGIVIVHAGDGAAVIRLETSAPNA
ncbi:hypothetical protein [Allonocardiopsis opalescens]|uniref:hypothetical protein n=1 Tax=Allonocardiopsis opalescens TaxID=1144618 RepID=UPI000D0528B6|nr:hypothetical protein [Allonocardiopsis opalescens]